MQTELIEKDYVFDNDPYNEGMFALYNVEGFRCTYRKTDEYEDEYKERNLVDWKDYINKMFEYGKKIPVLIHHVGGNDKPVYVGYLRNARVQNVLYPVRDTKTNKYEVQEDPALIFDIHNIRKEIKELILAGHVPNRSLSFAPRKDKKSDSAFDEISHFALLLNEEPPYIKFKDLNADSIEDISTDETYDFNEALLVKNQKPFEQYKLTRLKNYEEIPSMRAIQDIVDEIERDKENDKDFKWFPGLKVDNEFRKLVVKFMDVLDFPRKRAVAAAYNAIGRYGKYDFSEEDVREMALVSKNFTLDLPDELSSKALERIGKVFQEEMKNYGWLEKKFNKIFNDEMKNFAERWITIGEDKGVHVKIDDKRDKIVAGPESMEGKSIKEATKQVYESKTEKKPEKKPEKKVEIKEEEKFDKEKFKERGTKIIDAMLTEEEEIAMKEYCGTEYRLINQYLREGTGHYLTSTTKQENLAKSYIKEIDSAMEKVPKFEQPITVYRGASKKRFNLEQFEIGHEIELPAYQSTSLNKEATEEFAKGIMFQIKTSEGIYTNGTSEYEKEEEEVLLPRGRRYKITGVKGNIVDIELLPKEK